MGALAVQAAPEGPARSPRMAAYFAALQAEVERCYAIATKARARGFDPETFVEVQPAQDLAARVEAQVGPKGVAERIRELTRQHGNRELVALEIAKEVASESFRATGSRERAVDQAVRTGLSVLTEGILVAPLEGVAEVKLGRNDDGSDYVEVYYAGPIRAAGGTAQALSVLIADVVRRQLGIGAFRASAQEVERFKVELPLYKRAQHLQYVPTAEEIEQIVRHCPVSINGEGTEEAEVGAYRDLPRVGTNALRGGACLVLAEGMCLKAPKVAKHVLRLGLEGWGFLDPFVKKVSGARDEGSDAAIPPSAKYMRDLIAGRPVFSAPSRKGGFRLRYGRARTAGLASTAVHPAAMSLVEEFLATGTQMKVERPGKATIATPCSELEPPLVELRSGDLVEVPTVAEAKRLRGEVRRIVDLGEMLVPFGEFLENNHVLPRSPYAVEWWSLDLEAAGEDAASWVGRAAESRIAPREAFDLAERTATPLCPVFNLFWHDLAPEQVRALSEWVLANGQWQPRAFASPAQGDGVLVVPNDAAMKELLVELGALHKVESAGLVLDRYAYPLLRGLGLDLVASRVVEHLRRASAWAFEPREPRFAAVELVSRLAGVEVRPRGPFRIGARMGRPEKAAERKMQPPPHVLFPVAQAGGPQRLVNEAMRQGKVTVQVGVRRCPTCNARTYRTFCDAGHHTLPTEEIVEEPLDLANEVRLAKQSLGLVSLPSEIKGVIGTISAHKTPEPLEKGLLRAKHGVWTFKDGTVRFDATDAPLTHFRPREVGTSVARLRELGYTRDCRGEELRGEDQLLELRVQDVVPPRSGGEYLLKTAQFVDDLLTRFYKLEPYYGAKAPEDLVGHLVAGLAPHTSGAIVARVIGYTPASVCWAHPFFHAAKRRNCDGDEDALMLLMDGLLDFSRSYVPAKRGGLMDLPLVLTTRLDPNEIDKEAHNLDCAWRYPLALYEASARHAHPREVEKLVDHVASRLGTEAQYEGLGFTHDTDDLSGGVLVSAYKTLPTMMDKLTKQLELAVRLRGVDAEEVANEVIGHHFLPDLMGNLKAFSRQKLRCTKCGARYRRPPLAGVCTNEPRGADGKPRRCGYKLILTVTEASVRKYLDVSRELVQEYNLGEYTKQRLLLLERSIGSMFQSDKVKKAKLSDFL